MNTSPPSLEDLLACAVRAARSAGRHALRNWSRRTEVLNRFAHDVKLRLDVECQAKAEAVIRRAFPDHEILGEETPTEAGAASGPTTFQWIIDPIDGTVNFSHAYPRWGSSVAVRRGEDVLAGAVYAPAIRELYAATAESPSTCNQTPIAVSSTEALSSALVFTGLDKEIDPAQRPFALFEAIASRAQKTRISGSASLDICQVAAGRADGYFEASIYIWDIAAAGLIVRQAGGQVEVLRRQTGNRLQFLATNGRIHDALRRILAADPGDP